MQEQPAHSTKQQALRAIASLPENADMEDIMYRLYVLENIQHGRQSAENDTGRTTQELLKDLPAW